MQNFFNLKFAPKSKWDKSRHVVLDKERFDVEYLKYCVELEKTLNQLEAYLHTSDDPEEIAVYTLKTACAFYDGDWAGILGVDFDLGIWTPVWWYNTNRFDRTKQVIPEFEAAEQMPTWIRAMSQNEAILIADTKSIQGINPDEYQVYQRLHAESVIAVPFKPNPMGYLVIRNPKRHFNQTSMLNNLAYVLHRAMSQKQVMDSFRMTISPENIKRDTDVVIHLLGNLNVYTSRGLIREADFKSPMICKMLAFFALNPKTTVPPWRLVSVLWPEKADDADTLSKNVKYVLYRFRQIWSLISDYQLIESTASGYRINPNLNIVTDFQMFDHYKINIQNAISLPQKVELLKKAADIYEGHLFASSNSEDWILPTATHYALAYEGVVNELLKTLAELKDYPGVVKYSAQSMQIEPGNMRAHYWRIYALYQSGATEMAKASLPMAHRNLIQEEYDELIVLLRKMHYRSPAGKSFYSDLLI